MVHDGTGYPCDLGNHHMGLFEKSENRGSPTSTRLMVHDFLGYFGGVVCPIFGQNHTFTDLNKTPWTRATQSQVHWGSAAFLSRS